MCWHPTRWVPAEGRHGRATGRSRCRTRWRCSNRSFRVRATPSRWSGILTAPRRRWWQSSRSRIACGPWRCTSPRFSRCSTPNRRSERGRRDLSRRGCRRGRSRCRRPGPRHRILHRLLDGTPAPGVRHPRRARRRSRHRLRTCAVGPRHSSTSPHLWQALRRSICRFSAWSAALRRSRRAAARSGAPARRSDRVRGHGPQGSDHSPFACQRSNRTIPVELTLHPGSVFTPLYA